MHIHVRKSGPRHASKQNQTKPKDTAMKLCISTDSIHGDLEDYEGQTNNLPISVLRLYLLASKRRTKLCSAFLDMLEIAVSIVNATKRVNLQHQHKIK